MTGRREQGWGEGLASEAAAWVVRLAAEDSGEADALAFAQWVNAAPTADADRRREAFDRAQAIWLDLEEVAEAASARADPTLGPGRRPPGPPGATRHRPSWTLVAASAAGVAVVGLAAVLAVRVGAPPRPAASGAVAMTPFATNPGQRRVLWLKDGSRVDMDGATRLFVAAGERRRIVIERGEAVFDIVHDPARPFTVSAGVLQLRVLGTAFDVERDGGAERVAVARGAVSVSTGREEVRLAAGQAAQVAPSGGLMVMATPVAEVGAWRQDRRLYRDRPLSEVVADLNRRYREPARLSGAVAQGMRFTGVLVAGPDQAQTLRRLTALLPLTARRGRDGATVLSSRSR